MKKHKTKILAELNIPLLSMGIKELLNHFRTSLDDKHKRINNRIQSGENTRIVIKRNKKGDIYAIFGDMHSINRVNFALMHMFAIRLCRDLSILAINQPIT